jgi:hypothetical protein
MMAKPKTLPPASIRWDESESRLILALQDKLHVKAISELIRMGLKALADKEGVTV